MRRSRKDGNQDAIVAAFEALGCTVIEMHGVRIPGWPDLAVGSQRVTHLVECKNPETRYGRGGFNGNQSAFNQTWRGEKVWLCASADEAAALAQNWRKP